MWAGNDVSIRHEPCTPVQHADCRRRCVDNSQESALESFHTEELIASRLSEKFTRVHQQRSSMDQQNRVWVPEVLGPNARHVSCVARAFLAATRGKTWTQRH